MGETAALPALVRKKWAVWLQKVGVLCSREVAH